MKQNYSKQKQNKHISKIGMIAEAFNMQVVASQVEMIQAPIQKSAYSGGFKVPSVIKNTSQNQFVELTGKPEREDIFRELGITNEPNPTKMNNYLPQSKSQLQDKLVENIDSKIERIRLERAKLLDSGLKTLSHQHSKSPEKYNQDSNLMKIYDGQGRSQIAFQQPSSIEAMTLENVEAQLSAHRVFLKPIEEKYFQKKGRSPPRNLLTVQEQVQEEKKKLIYMVNKPPKPDGHSKVTEEELQRLFQQKKKIDPKLAEYQAKYREYQIQKTTQKLINKSVRDTLFKPNWDKYKQEVGKQKSKSKQKEKQLSNTTSENFNQTAKSLKNNEKEQEGRLQELQQKYSLQKIVLTKNDKYITKFIFKQIDPDKNGFISKIQLFEYVMSQDIIRKDFGIDQKWFYSDLDSFPTRRKGILSFEECLEFLSVQRQLKHPEIQLVDPENNVGNIKQQKGCLKLTKKDIQILQEVFKGLDPYDDKIIKRQELIDSLYMDPQVMEMLDRPAIYISVVDKSVSVRQILQLMISDFRNQKNAKAKKSKQYITLNQFLDYFNRWDSINLSNITNTSKTETNEVGIYDIEPEYLQLLQDTFNSIPRIYQDYICVVDFLEVCRKDPQIISIGDELCRINSVETGLGLENISLTLKRMFSQTDEFSCWNQLKLFFSRRGRPLLWDINQINLKKSVRQSKKAQIESQLIKSQARLTKKIQTQKGFGLTIQKQSMIIPGKFTIPDPFNITDMNGGKNIDFTEEGKQDFQKLKEGIKALPLNKQILQPKLEKLQKQRQQKSIQNRQQSKKRTAQLQKPFSFYQKQIIEKTLREAALRQMRKQPTGIENESNMGEINIDNLKKPYKDVLEQQAKQRGDPKKTTEFHVSDNLYPKNPAQIKKEKNRKVQQKMAKLDQIEKRKNDELQRIKKAKFQENKKKQDVLKKKKEIEQQQQKQKNDIIKKAGDATFKPKVNQYTPNPNTAEERANRENKEKQRIQKFIEEQEKKRLKRLSYQPKEQQKLNLDELNDNQIIDKLSDIDFQDLIDEEDVRNQFLKLKQFQKIPYSNKRKVNKDRKNALMARERLQMEKEEKRRRQELKEQAAKRKKQRNASVEKKATGQLQRIRDKKIDTKDNKFEGTFAFHKSKALRRYRDIMDGKTPLSQYDRMSHEQQSVKAQSIKDYEEQAKRIDDTLEQVDASQESGSIKEQQ